MLLAFPNKIYKYLSPTNADTLGARDRFSCFEEWINLKRSLLQELRNKIAVKVDFLLSRNFYPRAHLRVNKIEAMYEVLPVNAKVKRELLRLHTTFCTLPLFYFRTQKNTRQWKSTLRKLLTYNYKERDYIHL